ncbi:MAG: MOSC domain-containing protein [Gallionellaceae bacterium]|nr:MOSC domain-containing protein [Gallionellaceae bacterium]
MNLLLGRVQTVLTGRALPYTRPGSWSAIAKQPVEGPVQVHREGLTGDEQGDRRVHGGPDKAVHLYATEHYPLWRGELGARPVLGAPGAFGENLSTQGVTEADVCLGDRLRIGGALLEVSQSRQPCWKLNDRFGVPDMALRVQQTLRTGWYCRVLEPGSLQAGDAITLIARPHPDWPLLRLIELLYHRPLDRELLTQVRDLPLVPSWRRMIETRLACGEVESWAARIEGPAHDA